MKSQSHVNVGFSLLISRWLRTLRSHFSTSETSVAFAVCRLNKPVRILRLYSCLITTNTTRHTKAQSAATGHSYNVLQVVLEFTLTK